MCALVPAWTMSASPAAAQASNLEVGTVLAAGKVIWVRATKSGAVEFFMSPGYRDALARPVLVDANRLTQWTDSAKALQAPGSGVAEAKSAADTGLAFDRWVGTDSSGLEIKRDGSTVLRLSDTPARELVDLLARGAQLTERLTSPPQQVALAKDTVTHAAPQPTPAPAASITIQQVAVGQPAMTSVEATTPVNVAAPAAPPSGATDSAPAPATVVPDSAPAPASAPEAVSVQSSTAPDSAPAAPMLVPNIQPSIDATLPRDASPSNEKLETRRTPVAVAEVKADSLPLAALLDKHIQTPLGPFVVPGAKLLDHDTEIRYCYTELGLRYDRHLTGDVTVRVSVSEAGAADTVEVTKRTWDGVAAAEVESCMRAMIEDWSFDDRQPSDSKTVELHFTLTPAMRTAATDGASVQPSQPR